MMVRFLVSSIAQHSLTTITTWCNNNINNKLSGQYVHDIHDMSNVVVVWVYNNANICYNYDRMLLICWMPYMYNYDRMLLICWMPYMYNYCIWICNSYIYELCFYSCINAFFITLLNCYRLALTAIVLYKLWM